MGTAHFTFNFLENSLETSDISRKSSCFDTGCFIWGNFCIVGLKLLVSQRKGFLLTHELGLCMRDGNSCAIYSSAWLANKVSPFRGLACKPRNEPEMSGCRPGAGQRTVI